MKERIKMVARGGEGEIVEKKSRFIATVQKVDTEEAAIAFIEEMKKKYWDARHNCYAFSIGIEQPLLRFSDDGEPGGTAGKPILEVITGQQLHNIAIVVTRYFGGTLLGTGGLVRAYQGAAKEGLLQSTIVEQKLAKTVQVITDYTDIGKLQYLWAKEEMDVADMIYENEVKAVLYIPVGQVESIKKQMTELTSARAKITVSDSSFYYYKKDGKCIRTIEEKPQ